MDPRVELPLERLSAVLAEALADLTWIPGGLFAWAGVVRCASPLRTRNDGSNQFLAALRADLVGLSHLAPARYRRRIGPSRIGTFSGNCLWGFPSVIGASEETPPQGESGNKLPRSKVSPSRV